MRSKSFEWIHLSRWNCFSASVTQQSDLTTHKMDSHKCISGQMSQKNYEFHFVHNGNSWLMTHNTQFSNSGHCSDTIDFWHNEPLPTTVKSNIGPSNCTFRLFSKQTHHNGKNTLCFAFSIRSARGFGETALLNHVQCPCNFSNCTSTGEESPMHVAAMHWAVVSEIFHSMHRVKLSHESLPLAAR